MKIGFHIGVDEFLCDIIEEIPATVGERPL